MRAMKLLRLHPVTEFNLRKWIHHSKHDLSTGKSLQLSWASLAWPNWSFYRLRNKVGRDDPGAEYNSRGSKGRPKLPLEHREGQADLSLL
ncbi:hypothetical protein GQ55_2G477400 [Panicum hallii var. hallii]|uniref:Uncharacterized protein n=1 Tax=Panicum hallii var. hallii TaxID=1504633 RepID=A0A2T7F070_9POAL|nr:hypothetical protein GQ55_2G477400 [Panicum hallii var. hallii]